MRIEAVLRPKLWWPECRAIPNPFTALQLRRYIRSLAGDKNLRTELATVLRLARYDGLNAALLICDGTKKQRLLKKILQTQIECDWWDPAKLWRGFEDQFLEIDKFIGPSTQGIDVAVNCK